MLPKISQDEITDVLMLHEISFSGDASYDLLYQLPLWSTRFLFGFPTGHTPYSFGTFDTRAQVPAVSTSQFSLSPPPPPSLLLSPCLFSGLSYILLDGKQNAHHSLASKGGHSNVRVRRGGATLIWPRARGGKW